MSSFYFSGVHFRGLWYYVAMGTWGTRVYEDDVALDVRGDFLESRSNGDPIEEIEAAIRDEYYEEDVPEVNDVVTLALACVELETGTLTDVTRQAALEVIESGRQYEHWQREASADDAGRRKRELTLIKKYLETYNGRPVRRKSWLELQKTDGDLGVAGADEEAEKIEDVEWHMQEEGEGLTEEEYYANHASILAGMVHWLMTRGYLSNELAEHAETRRCMEGGVTIFAYLEDMLDSKLMSTEVRAGKARKFVRAYYASMRYYEDFTEQIVKDRDNYSFAITKSELELMAEVIDRRFTEYEADPKQFAAQEPADDGAVIVRKRSIPKTILASALLLLLVGGITAFAWGVVNSFARLIVGLIGVA